MMAEQARMVRIRVAADSECRFTPQGEFHVSDDGTRKVWTPADPETCRMKVDNIRIGIDFHWQQEVTMLLPGEVELLRRPSGRYDLFNILPVETYLTSVISSEMSADSPLEFLKAHAVISRSWVMGKILRLHLEASEGKRHEPTEIVTWEDTADHEGFDVCADDHCQRYQGVGRVNEAVSRAVAETDGILLRDTSGEVIDARFSKCCGGRTELFCTCWQDSDPDYLRSFSDPYCVPTRLPSARLGRLLDAVLMKYDRRTTDYFDWERTVSAAEITARLKTLHGIDAGRILNLEAAHRGPSGRIDRLCISTENGDIFIGKELAVRRLLSADCLYSSAFEISRSSSGDSFLLRGRGWGHGVGMCQIGGAVMAEEGADFRQILAFYYPNSTISV